VAGITPGTPSPSTDPLLGVVTLEEFRLAVDPVSRRLMPVPALLNELAA